MPTLSPATKVRLQELSLIVAFLTIAGVLLAAQNSKSRYPTALSRSEVDALVRDPSGNIRHFYGMAFYHDSLYIATYVGLLQVTHGRLSNVLSIGGDPHSSGPWSDLAHGLLWVLDKETRKLVSFDGKNWAAANEPLVSYDIGVWAGGNRSGFWMVYGGQGVFLWDHFQSRWTEVKTPKRDVSSYEPYGLLGVLPIGADPTLIVRHDGPNPHYTTPSAAESDTVSMFDGDWRVMHADSGTGFFSHSFASGATGGFICTYDGTVLIVSRRRVRKLQAPGPCEAVITSTNGRAVFSISSKGIYEFDGSWKRLAAYPMVNRGPHSQVFLTANEQEIAYAISDDGQGFSQLWMTENGKFRLVDLAK